MAMEDLLRIAERTEDLPDQALAQIAASGGGIESVIAASEMKARNDIRQDAQMMQQQAQPPVVDQLINMAMRQPMPPMGAPMPPQMQQPMGQPMPPQMGMQQPMPQPAPQPTPPQMAPDMAQLAQQMGVPAMNTGGLIRRFQTGTQGTIGGGQLDAFLAQQQLEDAGFTTEQFEGLTNDERIRVMQQIEDRKALVDLGAMAMTPVAALTDAAFFLPRQADRELSSLANTRLGKALGFSGPFDTPSRQPFDASQQRLQDFRQTLRPTTLPRFESALGISQAPDGTPVVTPNTTVPVVNQSVGSSAGQPGVQQQGQQGVQQQGQQGGQSTTIPFTGTQQNQMLFTGPTKVLGGGSATALDPSLAAIFNPSGTRSTATSKTTRTLSDEMLADLIKREGEYNQTINDATEKMKTLEGDLPTRENIKDRIKEQTRLGMAKAFFDAAGSGSPDFLSALAQGMGGAAGVMNKMTGEEQKELHQHALQMFQLEREKANTAFSRQEKTLSQIQAARQYEDARRVQDRQAQIDLLEFQRNYNDDVYKRNKDNADYQESYRAILADRTDKFNTAIQKHRDTEFRFDGDVRELDMELAINSGYGVQKVPQAERLENEGVRKLIGDMSAEAQKLTDAEKQLPLSQQEVLIRERLGKRYNEDSLLGRRAALDVHGPLLKDIFGSIDTDRYDSEVAKYLKTYPHIDPSLLTENASPIF